MLNVPYLVCLLFPLFDTSLQSSSDTFACTVESHLISESSRLTAYIVSIRTRQYVYEPGDNLFCGGVIINSYWILTAAHCVTVSAFGTRYRTVNRLHISVVASVDDRYSDVPDANMYRVSKIIVHENYERNTDNDVAMIRVENCITVAWQTFHRSVPLPVEPLRLNTKCATLTWGRKPRKMSTVVGSVSPYLGIHDQKSYYYPFTLAYNAQYIPYKICEQAKESERHEVNHLCLQTLTDCGMFCSEDTGNPLFCNNTLYGITASYSQEYKRSNPMIFSDIYPHVSWIRNVIRNLACCFERQSQLLWIVVLLCI